jgi:purine-cytosine permease-like protein
MREAHLSSSGLLDRDSERDVLERLVTGVRTGQSRALVLRGEAGVGKTAIVILDFFVLNRGRADVRALYAQPETSRYGDVRWRSLAALLVGLVAGWAFECGSASLFQGPIARATGGADLSWLASIVVGGSAYWLLSRSDRARTAGLDKRPCRW